MRDSLTTAILGTARSIPLKSVSRSLTPLTGSVRVTHCTRFESEVVSRANPQYLPDTILTAYPVTGTYLDDEIIPSLPDGYFFSEWEVCARLQQLAELQPRDIEGHLLSGGLSNIFYLRHLVVEMKYSFGKGWHASAYPKNELPWSKWGQVISRTPPC